MKTDKEALKALRQERKETLEKARALMKARNKTMREVKECLSGEGKTAPEVAAETGLKPSEALWCISGLRKYGKVVEGEKDGDYFRYKAVEETEAS